MGKSKGVFNLHLEGDNKNVEAAINGSVGSIQECSIKTIPILVLFPC